ncbi:MAG: hypothetical protein ACUZ8O_09920 [Candidatus Anammoxibacter sp.]
MVTKKIVNSNDKKILNIVLSESERMILNKVLRVSKSVIKGVRDMGGYIIFYLTNVSVVFPRCQEVRN